ncbi:unnamed protein product [Rotaria sp. Silwood1]|nr:unnamed protein product [Rotaria sp. Silwood1]
MITCIPCCTWKKQAPKHLLSSIKSSFDMFQHIEHKTGEPQAQKFRSLKTIIQKINNGYFTKKSEQYQVWKLVSPGSIVLNRLRKVKLVRLPEPNDVE